MRGIELLGVGPMPDVLLAEVARRKGSEPTTDPRPDVVAELFAGARLDLTFEPALALAQRWRPDLIVFEYCDFVGPLLAAVLECPSARLAYGRAYEPEFDAAMVATAAARYRGHGLEPAQPGAFLDTWPPSLQANGWAPPQGTNTCAPSPTATRR